MSTWFASSEVRNGGASNLVSVRLISGNGFKGRKRRTRCSEEMIPNLKKENEVATKQITVERFSVVSAKPFTEVVRAIEAQVGHPDIKQFYQRHSRGRRRSGVATSGQ